MRTRWLVHLGAWLALAAATHLLAVWALPRIIMQRVLAGVAAEAPAGSVLHPPLSDHTQRRIVMPSPDLLYALCVLDLGQGAWRVRARADRAGEHAYWSVALYAANTDNFHVVGDRQLAGQPLDLLVLGPHADTPTPAPPDATAAAPPAARVHAPSRKVLLLMRVLVGDATRDLAAADTARRSLRCERAG